ncbi:MAG TPA: hypothetical protein P5279_04470 [Anaerohalosphaeraceae bacterium]|jgi:hypothetical protein|nr:hypothetical protein [Anaerohalosphaeraceae bacterium]HRT49724.1 hypothetical protein [Anaerohalosphaeraceae bacterium]HRT87660.1 hypothetical protein [Anaerohalosphaeraceae bacterium]
MSLFVLRLPGLAMGPAFKMKDGQLRSRSSLLFCATTLGLYFKRAIVDPQAKVVRIRRRVLWFLAFEREIPFSHIARIDYAYRETVSRSIWSRHMYSLLDNFTVSLVLHDSDKWVKLWSFVGEGSGEPCLASCRVGPLIDLEGSQEEDSLYFVELLQYFTGKPLTRYG